MSLAAEALRQIVEGDDFTSPAGLLRSIKAEMAVTIPEGCPYSIATNVKHALIWQSYWLTKLRGETGPKIAMGQDFPVVAPKEWGKVRSEFVAGLEEAREIAQGDVDEVSLKILYKIVNHGAYHLGQVQLLKRILTGKS